MAVAFPETDLKTRLQDLNFEISDKNIHFLLENGEKCMDNPKILVMRLGISKEYADVVVEVLRKFTEIPIRVTEEDAKTIEECLREDPSMDNPTHLSLALGIPEKVVATYLASKKDIEMKAVKGPRLHFAENEGKKVLSIIRKYFPNDTEETIRKSIVQNEIPMKDKLMCVMRKEKPKDHALLVAYLAKFKDSKKFENVDLNLTFDNIKIINENEYNVDELSNKTQKVGTVIREFLERYTPKEEVEVDGYQRLQCKQVEKVAKEFGICTKTFMYIE